MVERCVDRGNNESLCRCALEMEKETLGSNILEALYLQATGDLQGYEQKLCEVVVKNPLAVEKVDASECRVKEQCAR